MAAIALHRRRGGGVSGEAPACEVPDVQAFDVFKSKDDPEEVVQATDPLKTLTPQGQDVVAMIASKQDDMTPKDAGASGKPEAVTVSATASTTDSSAGASTDIGNTGATTDAIGGPSAPPPGKKQASAHGNSYIADIGMALTQTLGAWAADFASYMAGSTAQADGEEQDADANNEPSVVVGGGAYSVKATTVRRGTTAAGGSAGGGESDGANNARPRNHLGKAD